MHFALEKHTQVLSKLLVVAFWLLLAKALLWVVTPFLFIYFI